MSGCTTAPKKEDPQSKPQEATQFSAMSQGRNGELKVEVSFDGNSIKTVNVVNNTETKGVADPALEMMPKRIVDNQSLAVDLVTGATITSNAILAAVSDCIKQAGLNEADFKKEIVKEHKEETLTADVLVIGGGGAGLSAAIEAANQGAKVILIEKLSTTGGSTKLSMGMVVTGSEAGNENKAMTAEEYAQQLMNYAGKNEDMNFEMIKDFANHSAENGKWLIDNGFDAAPFVYKGWAPMAPDGDWKTAQTTAMVLVNGTPEDGKGSYLTNALTDSAKKIGVDVMVDTAGTELIVDENNAVSGAKAHNSSTNTDYTINAKAVILATGSFGSNKEMMEEYAKLSGFEKGLGTYVGGAGNTGDGIIMAEKVGAKTGMYFTGSSATETITYDTTGGVYIDEKTQVLDESGKPIANLYAAGEMTNILLMGDMYVMCGTYNGWSVYTGRIAGSEAATK